MKPPQYLEAGDVMELSIEKLGEQRQTVVPPFNTLIKSRPPVMACLAVGAGRLR